jgi:hypothetical protein
MTKNKLNTKDRKRAIKRALKRSKRLRKTRQEKPLRKAHELFERKGKEKKFKEAMDKLLQSRGLK